MTRPGMSSRTGIHGSNPDQFGPIGFLTWRFGNPWLRSWSTNEGPKASQISNPNPMGQNQTKSTTLYLSTFSRFLIEMKSKSTIWLEKWSIIIIQKIFRLCSLLIHISKFFRPFNPMAFCKFYKGSHIRVSHLVTSWHELEWSTLHAKSLESGTL